MQIVYDWKTYLEIGTSPLLLLGVFCSHGDDKYCHSLLCCHLH